MAQLAVLIAGSLLIVESQASDVAEADPSAVQGFLSKYMMAATQRAPTSTEGASRYMIIDDKPVLHQAPQVQDSFAFTSASGMQAMNTKDSVDAHLMEHAMLELAISFMAVVREVHCIAPCSNM